MLLQLFWMILNGCSLLLVVRCRKLQVLCVAWLGDGTFRPAKFRIFGRELGRCFPWWMMQSPDTRTEISTGWWFGCHFLFSHILGTIIPIDYHIFQRGGPTTNQSRLPFPAIFRSTRTLAVSTTRPPSKSGVAHVQCLPCDEKFEVTWAFWCPWHLGRAGELGSWAWSFKRLGWWWNCP